MKVRKERLLANHGMIEVEEGLKRTIWLAVEAETPAAQYWAALRVGKPNILSDAAVAAVIERFKRYGQPKSKTPAACR